MRCWRGELSTLSWGARVLATLSWGGRVLATWSWSVGVLATLVCGVRVMVTRSRCWRVLVTRGWRGRVVVCFVRRDWELGRNCRVMDCGIQIRLGVLQHLFRTLYDKW